MREKERAAERRTLFTGVVLAPLLLAALFGATRAEASLERTSAAERAPAPSTLSSSLERALTLEESESAPDPAFDLFTGDELARALDAPRASAGARGFHPLAAVSLFSKDGAEAPLVSAEPLRLQKTRYRVFDFLGQHLIGVQRELSLELQWGSGRFGLKTPEGIGIWLSQDPEGDVDSPNLYSFVGMRPHEKTDPLGLAVSYARNGTIVISDERSPRGGTFGVTASWAESHPDEFFHLLRDVGGLGPGGAGEFLAEHQLAPTGEAGRQFLFRQVTRDTDELIEEAKSEWMSQAKWGALGYGAGKLIGVGAKAIGQTKVGQFLARDVTSFLSKSMPKVSASPVEYGSFGGETLDDSLRMTEQPLGVGSGGSPAAPKAYSVAYEYELGPADYGMGRGAHVARAEGAMKAQLANDPEWAAMMEETLNAFPKWTWEHASSSTAQQRLGVLRLVPRYQHTPGSPWWRVLHPDKGASGGYAEWAIPAGAPPNR